MDGDANGGQMGQQNGGKNDNVLSGTDAAAWSQALLATLVAAPQQGPPPSNNEDFNLLQALLAASQTQNAGQTSSNNSDSAAALLLASQLQRPASNVGALSPTQEHAGPSATLYGNSPNINRPRKSKKFRYSAVLKQIRQAEADGNPIRVDRLGVAASLPILPSEITQSTQQQSASQGYSCGDAQCQQQLVALQTQLSYYRLEVDTLREALKALLAARKDAAETPSQGEQCLDAQAEQGPSNDQEKA